MKISANIVNLHRVYKEKKIIDELAKAGFEAIDFNHDIQEFFSDEHDKAFYVDLKNYILDKGMEVGQTHSPFATSFIDEERTAKRFEDIVRSIKFSSYLGAPMTVVHAFTHLDYTVDNNDEKLFEQTFNFYKKLIPYAEEYGVKISIENLGTGVNPDPNSRRNSVVSSSERLIKLLNELNNPVFNVCFDVGHSLICGFNPADEIMKLGGRIGCTHIHDNDAEKDLHYLPFYGKNNWEEIMKALALSGYAGNLSYESGACICNRSLPVELYEHGLKYMVEIARYLRSRFEYYKKEMNK